MSDETVTLIAGLAFTIEFGPYSINAAQICRAHLTLNEMGKEPVLTAARHPILVKIFCPETQVISFECHSGHGSRPIANKPIPQFLSLHLNSGSG